MKKKNKMRMMVLLMVGLLSSDVLAERNASLNTFAQGACAVAGALIGAAGVAKIAEWCFFETNNQLVARGQSELKNALRYSDKITLFEFLGFCGPIAAVFQQGVDTGNYCCDSEGLILTPNLGPECNN